MTPLEEDIRSVIVRAARDIFARYGFKKATMDDIARAAHKAKSSLYHYFKSKEDIFRVVVEKECSDLEKELTCAMDREQTPQSKLYAYVITRMEAFNRYANFYSAFKDEYLEHYDFIQDLIGKYDKIEIEKIKNILKQGIDQGIFVIKNLDLAALCFCIAMKGLEYHWAIEKDISKVRKYVDNLLDIFFNGVVKR